MYKIIIAKMKTIGKTDWYKLQTIRCNKGKHKFRTNKFGVTWCVICGMLGSYNTSSQELEESDKLLIDPSV